MAAGPLEATTPLEKLERLDGLAVHRRTAYAEGGGMAWRIWGDGPVQVLLHGWAGSWRHWARNIELLSRRYRLLVADLPGQGDSDPLPATATRADVARAVMSGVTALLGERQRFSLCGFSYGGNIAAICAGLDERNIDRLILVAPGGMTVDPVSRSTRRIRGLPDAERFEGHRHNLEAIMFSDARRIDALAIEIQEQNTRLLNSRRPAREPALLQSSIQSLGLTPQFIWGAQDNVVGSQLDDVVHLVQRWRPRDADTHVIGDAGHWVMYEAAREFLALIEERS
jgi:pimeloyl-ACP methyl ester carboxylesterase